MKIEIRSDSVHIEGYVNAVGRLSRTLTDDDGRTFREMIEPGAFGRALANGGTIRALLDHDGSRVLADTSGTLQLKEDSIGLHADMVSRDAELLSLARDGRLRGWSFGFIPLDSKETFSTDGERSITVTELDLREVSVIDERMVPAYAGTSISARAEEAKVAYRAMDDDVVMRTIVPPDYSRYDEILEKLKRA